MIKIEITSFKNLCSCLYKITYYVYTSSHHQNTKNILMNSKPYKDSFRFQIEIYVEDFTDEENISKTHYTNKANSILKIKNTEIIYTMIG